VECQLKDETISDEYLSSFPSRITLVKDILLPITKFKKEPLNIIYHPLSRAPHKQNKNLYYVLQQVSHEGFNFCNFKGFKETKWHSFACPNEVGGNPRLEFFIGGGYCVIIATKANHFNFVLLDWSVSNILRNIWYNAMK
jgi:hypothetical protein